MAKKQFWIQDAIKKPGALKKALGVSKKTGNIPLARVKAAAKKRGVTGRRARLAMTLKSFNKKK